MKKRITIIAIGEKMAEGYKKDISNFFEDTIEVEASSIDKIEHDKKIETDLILISANSIFRLVKPYALVDCEIITINKTLSKKGFEKNKRFTGRHKCSFGKYRTIYSSRNNPPFI